MPTKGWHWDRDGKPLGWFAWAWLCEQRSYREVARGYVLSRATADQLHGVSTIWTGVDLNHGLVRQGLPAIFDTGIFRRIGSTGTQRDFEVVEVFHATTEAQARTLHDHAMETVIARVADPLVMDAPVVPPRPREGWAVEVERVRPERSASVP